MKKIILAFLVVSIFLFSGCIFGGSTDTTTGAFAGGTSALEMSFIEGMPPESILKNMNFNVGVLLENKGEADVKAGDVLLTLNKPSEMTVESSTKLANAKDLTRVKKVSDSIIPGKIEQVTWKNAKISGLSPLTEAQTVTVSVDACYPYSTKLMVPACVAKGTEICNPKENKLIESSGGPIQAVDFMQSTFTKDNKIELSFSFSVRSAADSIYSGTSSCSALKSEKKNIVNIKSITLGNKLYPVSSCSPQEITLSDNAQGSARCKLVVDTTSDFQDSLVIDLYYINKHRISQEVSIDIQ